MTKCVTIDVSEGGGEQPGGPSGGDGSPQIPTLSAPSSANSGEEFSVSYQVCCNGGSCPYGIQLYVNSDEVHNEELNLSSECASGSIGVTIDGDGEYIITLVYGQRAMDRSVHIEGDGSSGGGEPSDPGDGSGDGGDGLFPDLPGGGGSGTDPQLPLGLTRNQALAVGGGALGIVVLSSGSGRPRPVRYMRGDQ